MIANLYESFKKWAEIGSVYIISDLHFDDPEKYDNLKKEKNHYDK